MAEMEEVTLDGKPLHALRVADLKSALEQRGLPKSGQKNALVKRLKGALMLENLQRTSSPHMGLQPNSQIGEEMSQNSFIKQYLAKQQELLRQRLEREAREVAEPDDSFAEPDNDDHTKDGDVSSCSAEFAEEVMSAEARVLLPQSSASLVLQPHASDGPPAIWAPGPRALAPGPLEVPVAPPAPLQGVASLSVRVLAPPPRSGPQLAPGGSDDDEGRDEEWGVGPRRSQPSWETSRRKQRPPWHFIPLQQQLPTPPPAFPLPDTPKQSPPGPERLLGVAGAQGMAPSAQERPGAIFGSLGAGAPVAEATAPPTRDVEPPARAGPVVIMETGEQETSVPKAGGSPWRPKVLEEEREAGVSPGHANIVRDMPPCAPAASPCLPVPPEESHLLSAPPRPDPGVLLPGGGAACVAVETGVGGEWAGPGGVAPVLPPSPPPEEGESSRAKLSSSSDSSSSDSDSSSQRSASSSSRDEAVSARWRGDLGSLGSRRKRRGEQEEEDGEVSNRKNPRPEDGDGGEMKRHRPTEVPLAGPGSVAETEACSERQGPAGGSMGKSQESPTACSAPQISLPTVIKPAPVCGPVAVGTLEEAESRVSANRKRRWDSNTTDAAKQQLPSGGFSSLKSLVPDPLAAMDLGSQQEAVVELHPEEGRLSEDEREEPSAPAGGLQIQHAVTRKAPAAKQENGQKVGLEEEDEDGGKGGGGDRRRSQKEERKDRSHVATERRASGSASKRAPPSGAVGRHSSRHKSGVSRTADDHVSSTHKPATSHGKATNIIHVCNLVRPFMLVQLKELLSGTGPLVEEGFWINKIKSHCYVTYPSVKEAMAARTMLQGLKWPQTNPRVLRVEFCQQDELDHHRAQLDGEGAGQGEEGVEWDQQAQRQRERERRERARGEREWDRDKVTDFSRPGEEQPCSSPQPPPERREPPRKETPPGKLLEDLFCKTTAPPCIYWLPLTEQQVLQRKAERVERMKEREKRRKELQLEEERKREERRMGRSKEAEGVADGGGASQPVTGEKEREKESEKVRESENEEKVRGKEERGREEKGKERGKDTGRGEKEKERGRGEKGGERERGREEKGGDRERGREEKAGERERRREEKGGERERGREEKAGERERGREEKAGERESRREEKGADRERGREEKTGERERGREDKTGERERGREEKTGQRERGREEKAGERERGREEKAGERERGREEKGGERERGREEKTGERERGREEKTGERERGREEKAGERERGREDKTGERERGREEKTGERERGREEKGGERERGREDKGGERERVRERGVRSKRADSKSRGGRRSRSHSNPPPRDRRH